MKSLGKGLLCLIVLFNAINDLSAQNSSVTIGPGDLKSSAVLWLVPTGGQGLLLPSISTATRTSMSLNATDEKGMMVFDNQLNKVFYWNGSAWVEASGSGAGGSGTVTSVGLSLPSSVFGAATPITTSGNLTSTFNSQTAATVFAAPSGAAGVPSFRALTNTDIPSLDAGKITAGSFSVLRGGTGLTTSPANGQLLIGNGTGYVLSTLTAGAGVSITNGAGTITISSSGLSNPMTSNGDIIFGGASGVPTRLAGSAGFLKSTGAAAPTWSALAATDIPNLDAAKISTGSFGVARGGTGLTAAPTNGQFLIGNGTGYSLATLTQGTGVTITNGAGTVTISASGLSNPMTATGDIIFGGASGTPSRLAGAAGVLKSTGAAAPAWGAVNLNSAEVTGTLPLTQGGTGATTAALARTNLGLGSLSTLSSVSTTEITNGTIGIADLSNMGATANQILQYDGSTWAPINTPTGGSGVTSVALSLPAIFSVTGSPVTTTGTLSATLASQAAATVFAAPAGGPGAPTFRALTATDIPNHDAAKITTGSFGVARGGTGLATTPTNGQILIGNGTGYSLATLTQGSGVTITNGAGTVTIASTGLSNPMTTTGDIIFGGATGTPTRLAGSAGFLKSTGAAAPTWSALAATDVPNLDAAKITTGSFGTARGGTGLTTTPTNGQILIGNGTGYSLATLTQGSGVTITNGAGTVTIASTGLTNPMSAAGDMIVGGASGTPTRLAIGTGILRSNGATQSWTSIDMASTDVTGTLPVANGGTGRTTWDGLLIGSGSTINDISTGANGQILKASGGTPSWQNFVVTDVEIQDNSIMNADINTAANIDGSKINTAFGNKNISTTGTLSSGAITATNLASINSVSYAWPAAQGGANSVLQNNGSGTLSWATVATAFSASNTIIKGNAAGTAQVASSMTDDGTTVSSTADINITTGNFYKINNQNFVGLSGTTSTHFGAGAGSVNTGLHNTFVGFEAGNGTTSGEDNLFVGRRAGYSNTTAGYNTYVGKNAGYFNTTGLNTFIGWSAGYNTGGMLTGGSTFVGANAGYASTGSYNTFIGEQAGENNVGGEFNVFLGRISGASNIGGDQITLIGHGADVTVDNLINATAIGYNAEVSTSSSLVLGGTGAQVVNVGIGVTGPSTDLHVVHGNTGGAANGDGLTIQNGAGAHSWTMFVSNSTGNLVLMQDLSNTVMGQFDDSNGTYTQSSDRRLKKNINDLELVLPRISAMNVRRYHYKRQKDSDPTNIGVIAQELQEVFPELVKYAPEQDTYTVDYMSMAPLAIKAIQEQQTMIEELQKQVTELQSKLKKEEDTNSQLSAKLESLLDDVEAIKKSVGLDQKAQNTPKK
jgi:hypothetical protein